MSSGRAAAGVGFEIQTLDGRRATLAHTKMELASEVFREAVLRQSPARRGRSR
jgi:hypothetical protein